MNIEMVQNTIAYVRDKVHPGCVVCSSANSKGLHLKFEVKDDKSVEAGFQYDESFQGYPGILHGGVISSILDGAMGNCMFAYGLSTVTVEMTTRFKLPVLTEQDATVSARIIRSSHPLYLLEAEIIQDEKVRATAKGKYYDQPEFAHLMEGFS